MATVKFFPKNRFDALFLMALIWGFWHFYYFYYFFTPPHYTAPDWFQKYAQIFHIYISIIMCFLCSFDLNLWHVKQKPFSLSTLSLGYLYTIFNSIVSLRRTWKSGLKKTFTLKKYYKKFGKLCPVPNILNQQTITYHIQTTTIITLIRNKEVYAWCNCLDIFFKAFH